VTGTLPAQGFSEHWYKVIFVEEFSVQAGGLAYTPSFGLTSGALDYVVDAYYVLGNEVLPMTLCGSQQPPLSNLPALGITHWQDGNLFVLFDPATQDISCSMPGTPVLLRVRPVSLNYQCASYTLFASSQP
jgi:hypothetical protein